MKQTTHYNTLNSRLKALREDLSIKSNRYSDKWEIVDYKGNIIATYRNKLTAQRELKNYKLSKWDKLLIKPIKNERFIKYND